MYAWCITASSAREQPRHCGSISQGRQSTQRLHRRANRPSSLVRTADVFGSGGTRTERSVSTAAGVDHELGEAVRWVEGYAVRQLSDRD